jgi:hypothetical protein
MKKIHLFIIVLAIFTLTSCYRNGTIKIQNNISNVKITDVYWGNLQLASELLPGESSGEKIIQKVDEKLPASHKITFVMTADSKSVYLETDEEYLLDRDQDLLIKLTDETLVNNPNDY